MTDASDRPPRPEGPETSELPSSSGDDAPDRPSRPEGDPLEELRRRQYADRRTHDRDERNLRERDAAEEVRRRREREARERERREREARERREREEETAVPDERPGGESGPTTSESPQPSVGREPRPGAPTPAPRPEGQVPRGRPESTTGDADSPVPDVLRRPRPSVPGDPRAPGRPRPGQSLGDDGAETRPLPAVEPGDASVRPPDPRGEAAVRKPRERPEPVAFASPGTGVDERPSTRREPPETRPMPRPARPRPGPEAEPTQAVATPGDEAEIPRLSRPPRPARPTRGRLTAVDVRSIFKLALIFYLGILAVFVAGGIGLWFVLTATGVIGNFESFVGELLGYEDFEFIFSRIVVVCVLAGLVWVVLSATATALFAVIYNRASRLAGGLGFTVDDDEA